MSRSKECIRVGSDSETEDTCLRSTTKRSLSPDAKRCASPSDADASASDNENTGSKKKQWPIKHGDASFPTSVSKASKRKRNPESDSDASKRKRNPGSDASKRKRNPGSDASKRKRDPESDASKRKRSSGSDSDASKRKQNPRSDASKKRQNPESDSETPRKRKPSPLAPPKKQRKATQKRTPVAEATARQWCQGLPQWADMEPWWKGDRLDGGIQWIFGRARRTTCQLLLRARGSMALGVYDRLEFMPTEPYAVEAVTALLVHRHGALLRTNPNLDAAGRRALIDAFLSKECSKSSRRLKANDPHRAERIHALRVDVLMMQTFLRIFEDTLNIVCECASGRPRELWIRIVSLGLNKTELTTFMGQFTGWSGRLSGGRSLWKDRTMASFPRARKIKGATLLYSIVRWIWDSLLHLCGDFTPNQLDTIRSIERACQKHEDQLEGVVAPTVMMRRLFPESGVLDFFLEERGVAEVFLGSEVILDKLADLSAPRVRLMVDRVCPARLIWSGTALLLHTPVMPMAVAFPPTWNQCLAHVVGALYVVPNDSVEKKDDSLLARHMEERRRREVRLSSLRQGIRQALNMSCLQQGDSLGNSLLHTRLTSPLPREGLPLVEWTVPCTWDDGAVDRFQAQVALVSKAARGQSEITRYGAENALLSRRYSALHPPLLESRTRFMAQQTGEPRHTKGTPSLDQRKNIAWHPLDAKEGIPLHSPESKTNASEPPSEWTWMGHRSRLVDRSRLWYMDSPWLTAHQGQPVCPPLPTLETIQEYLRMATPTSLIPSFWTHPPLSSARDVERLAKQARTCAAWEGIPRLTAVRLGEWVKERTAHVIHPLELHFPSSVPAEDQKDVHDEVERVLQQEHSGFSSRVYNPFVASTEAGFTERKCAVFDGHPRFDAEPVSCATDPPPARSPSMNPPPRFPLVRFRPADTLMEHPDLRALVESSLDECRTEMGHVLTYVDTDVFLFRLPVAYRGQGESVEMFLRELGICGSTHRSVKSILCRVLIRELVALIMAYADMGFGAANAHTAGYRLRAVPNPLDFE